MALALTAVLAACEDRRPSDEVLVPGEDGVQGPSDDVTPDETTAEDAAG